MNHHSVATDKLTFFCPPYRHGRLARQINGGRRARGRAREPQPAHQAVPGPAHHAKPVGGPRETDTGQARGPHPVHWGVPAQVGRQRAGQVTTHPHSL